MRKAGKPNSFMKGMQMDVDPLLQPKESYRYAKNIRLASYQGKNISIQPYDSDRLALVLSSGDITSVEIPTISDVLNWSVVVSSVYDNWSQLTWQSFFNYLKDASLGIDVEEYFTSGTLSDNYNASDSAALESYDWFEYAFEQWDGEPVTADYTNYNGETIPGFYEGGFWIDSYTDFLANYTTLPVTTECTGIGDSNSDGIGLSFTVTLTESDESEIVEIITVPPFANISNATQDQMYFELIIANQLTALDNGYSVTVSAATGTSNLWTFASATDNTVTGISIVANGDIAVTTNMNGNAIEQQFYNHFEQNFANSAYGNEDDSAQTSIALSFASDFGVYFQAAYNGYLSTISGVDGTIAIENFLLLENTSTSALEGLEQNSIISPGMQILGHYAFSDYLVILGTWIENEAMTGYPSDFVLKTSQKKDGTLVGVGEEGIYELFFVGNLGFSNKKKLKVTGAEENENVRRIYFTDGEIPLRTMNVGADPVTYAQYTNDPGFFDLFVETKISIPRVTGFVDGGSLESIGHAYAFRYKTLDGRMSRISPVCNPASLPVSGSAQPAAFSKGGNPNKNTSKSIKGVIDNLDTRYPYVEMIHIPYIGGAPGVAQVFATLPIASDDTSLSWTHTGNEVIREEIIALEFGSDHISWDTCQALEVKDNRLFVGNLKGVAESVDTDFTITSYNSWNEPHPYETGNPDLYNDLLYSWAGVSYDSNGESPDYHGPQEEDFGRYTKPNGNDFYRYIKGPSDGVQSQGGLYTSTLSAPEYWTAANTAPSTFEVKRGIFGAESKHFGTPLDGTDLPAIDEEVDIDGNIIVEAQDAVPAEYEGVRVTFKVLGAEASDDRPVELDKDDKLISTGSEIAARPPFYRVDKHADTGGYYANYANPMYNSNYVGYRRGEIYRFGLLFYDKKGSPMFVKRIGDIRMPEHSTEYISPSFGSNGEVQGFDMKWPYYFQTSRSSLDGGFVDWPNATWDDANYIRPYSQNDKGGGQKACVLYPYFEVKLSAETCQKISGYSIVRVERTPENRTISTSGVLQRAVRYADDKPESIWNSEYQDTLNQGGSFQWKGANRAGMAGRFGNYHNSIFTPTVQDYCSHIYGNSASDFSDSDSKQFFTVGRFHAFFGTNTPLIGGDPHWSHSNIFTMDSPDAIINSDFNLNFSNGDRIKITEQRYCIKQTVVNGGSENNRWPHFWNMYLSDGFYGGKSGSGRPDMDMPSYSINLFACQIDPELLKGEDIYYYQEETTTADEELTVQNFGGWKHKISDRDRWSTDWTTDLWTFDMLWRRTEGYYQGNWDDTSNPRSGNSWTDTDDEPSIHQNDSPGKPSGDINLGIYTKYYSKRIGAYPMYGMARPDWNKYDYTEMHNTILQNTTGSSNGDAGGEGFGMNTRCWQNSKMDDENTGGEWMYPCFTGLAAWKRLPGASWEPLSGITNANGNLNDNPDEDRQISQYLSLSGDEQYLEYIGGDYSWGFYGKYNGWGGVRATNVIPDIFANGGIDGSTNAPGERIDSYTTSSAKLDPYWRESKIYHAQIVNPGEEVSDSTLGSDRPYRNATMWHDPHAQNRIFSLNSTSRNERNFSLGGNVGCHSSGYQDETDGGLYSESRADFSLGHKTIVMSLPHHAMLPITRHCLQANNWKERVYFQFGGPNLNGFKQFDALDQMGDFLSFAGRSEWSCGANLTDTSTGPSGMPASGASSKSQYGKTGRGAKWSVDSPEVTMASIVKNHNANTLYGGNSSIAFSKNTFVSTGSFRQVNQTTAYNGAGNNGLRVFGGDTFISNFSLKKVHNPDTSAEYSDRGVLTAYTCPVETETNLDLRHGYFFGSDTQNIAKQIPDDSGRYAYNPSYDAENKIQIFSPKPFGFIEVDHWPSTVAFSDPKMSGDTIDNYSVFPVNQIKDLDYTKGPITQMFTLQNKLFALQDSGTCQLSVNPRVMIPSGEGGAIQAVTGTDNVIERYDYVSDSLGSQHYHGLAVTENGAYYYDDNASKFLQLRRTQGGGFGVISLGDTAGMQTFFQQYTNETIHDVPLMSPATQRPAQSSGSYAWDYTNFDTTIDQDWGGINIGYDPEFGEILLSICNHNPYTLVYSENLGVFTSFISKRPSNYINFKNRLYCTYDFQSGEGNETSNTSLYLSNGWMHHADDDIDVGYRYLTFGQQDYYILGHGNEDTYSYNQITYAIYAGEDVYPTLESELQTFGTQSDLLSKEPIQIHFVLNDESSQPKIFDNIDIHLKGKTVLGDNYLYFRKFTFLGSANLGASSEYDASEFTGVDQNYSNAANGFSGNSNGRPWYTVKDGTHHVPLRMTGVGEVVGANAYDTAVRGTYAIVAASMGWDEGHQFFGSEADNGMKLKNEGFNILSLVPYYRYSRR